MPRAVRQVVRRVMEAVRQPASEGAAVDIGERLVVGRHTYGKPYVRCYEGDAGSVRIGSFCSVADDVVMTIGGNHVLSWPSTYPFRARRNLAGAFTDGHPAPEADIDIGSDVWIGRGVRVLAGVRIGHGAVIGAYAVVAKDVRPYAIVVGNPAREVRRRLPDEQVEALLRIAWWDWPDEKVTGSIQYLNQPDVEGFIARFGGEVL
jgi:acetyltransferase-like isoleucine patch superfamily enzyme